MKTVGVPTMEKDPTPFEHNQDTQGTHVNAENNIVVPATEEDVTATTQPVDRGAVRIEKDVVEEQQTLEVPVTEEEVNVSRRAVDRQADPADFAVEGKTIRIPIRGEEVEVEKRTRVSEEIDVTKGAVTHIEEVTETVRREEVLIGGEGQSERSDDAAARSTLSSPSEDRAETEPKTGRFLGLPYDWRKPSWERIRSNLWNPESDSIAVRKSYGWGYEVNLHALLQRAKAIRKR
jgi:uncharacterized protein (TIGR02271 family)